MSEYMIMVALCCDGLRDKADAISVSILCRFALLYVSIAWIWYIPSSLARTPSKRIFFNHGLDNDDEMSS